jgi:hypothetical protein
MIVPWVDVVDGVCDACRGGEIQGGWMC